MTNEHSEKPAETSDEVRVAIEANLKEFRPRLHRYAARMVGSVLDAEDVVQEGLASALSNWPASGVENLEGWLFRIVHNRAIDHLRRVGMMSMEQLSEDPIADQGSAPLEDRELAGVAMSVFLKLTPLQRSVLILKDVLGFSLLELSEMLDISVGAVKSSLFRGRQSIRRLAPNREDGLRAQLSNDEAALLGEYVERFSKRDFDGLRERLLQDVQLDLVGRTKDRGSKSVGQYFGNYALIDLDGARPVIFEGRSAMLISDKKEGEYVVLVEWKDGLISSIRDFRYSRYIMDGARILEV